MEKGSFQVATKCTVGREEAFAKGALVISFRHILLPFLLAMSLLVQLSLPWVQMRAVKAGFNAGSYICNLDGRVPTREAQAHIQAFLKLAGKNVPYDESPAGEHCSACIMPNLAVLSSVISVPLSQSFYTCKASFPKTRPEIYHFAQGPPLGSRAPPSLS